LDLAGQRRGGIGGHIADHHQFRTPLGFQVGAVVEHLFKGNGGQQRPAFLALEVRYLGDHLDRHYRLIVGFAFLGGVHHLRIPGFGLLQLFFGRRIAEVSLQQIAEQRRKVLGIAVGIDH